MEQVCTLHGGRFDGRQYMIDRRHRFFQIVAEEDNTIAGSLGEDIPVHVYERFGNTTNFIFKHTA